MSPGAPAEPISIECPSCSCLYRRYIDAGDWSRDGNLRRDAEATCPNCEHVVLLSELRGTNDVWRLEQSAPARYDDS
jgi:hypothetical protein